MAVSETPIQPTDRPGGSGIMRLLLKQETVLAIILVIAVLILSTQTNKFLTADNILNQGRLLTEVALMALPMTFIIITGGIDLSVGSILGLTAIVLGYTWKNLGMPLEVAIVFALAVGTFAGFVNGFFIVKM